MLGQGQQNIAYKQISQVAEVSDLVHRITSMEISLKTSRITSPKPPPKGNPSACKSIRPPFLPLTATRSTPETRNFSTLILDISNPTSSPFRRRPVLESKRHRV